MVSCSRSFRFRSLKSSVLLTALGLAALGPLSSPRASAQVAVLTQNNDNARTGANTAETVLTPAAVGAGQFGKLFTLAGLDASVNGQALYVPGVTVNGAAHNVLYAYTSDNRDHSNCGLNAFDADTGIPLWHTLLPLSATYTTATPVIDPAAGTMYVLTKTDNDDTGQTFLRAFDITTGAEKTGSPVQVTASAPGTGDGSVGGRVSFDGPAASGRFHANDRPGLLLLNGVVYIAFAHNSDSFPYHGWILGYKYDGTKFTQTASFCTTPNGGDGGIWQAGKGLTADANGYIYCSVGNGTFDANTKGITAGTDYGMCYLKLRASDLSVADWFAPFDEQGLSNSDLDLGNSGLVGIPGTTRLFGGGTKFGAGFLLDSANLGQFTSNGPDKVVLRLNGLTGNDSVGQNPVAWDAGAAKYVYLWANGSNLEQFRYDPAVGTFSPAGIYKQSSGLTSGGSLAVSSSGASGGLLWGVGSDGVVRAFDATDVSKAPLWTSALNSARDGLGSPGHFQFPTVVNGKVYVGTSGRSIAVYGLLASATVPGAATQARFFPRTGFASRMVGGKFQGSQDGVTYTDLATITQAPASGQYSVLPLPGTTVYRYLRYLAPAGGYGNIAELEFDSGTAASPVKLAGNPFGTPGSWQSQGNDFTKVFDGNTGTFFDAPDPGNSDYVGIDLGGATTPTYQIDCGGGAASPFAADGFVQGGGTYTSSAPVSTAGITNPAPQAVYQSERYGNFTYTLTGLTPSASYTLRLHFAEIYWNSAGARVFNVTANKQSLISNFDIFAAAGGTNKAIVKSFTTVADPSGTVTIVFSTVKDNAKVSGIELLH